MATVQETLRPPGTPDQQSFIARKILEMLSQQIECSLEDLAGMSGARTSDQVFLEVDRMSRAGELCLLYKKDGGFSVTLRRRHTASLCTARNDSASS